MQWNLRIKLLIIQTIVILLSSSLKVATGILLAVEFKD